MQSRRENREGSFSETDILSHAGAIGLWERRIQAHYCVFNS